MPKLWGLIRNTLQDIFLSDKVWAQQARTYMDMFILKQEVWKDVPALSMGSLERKPGALEEEGTSSHCILLTNAGMGFQIPYTCSHPTFKNVGNFSEHRKETHGHQQSSQHIANRTPRCWSPPQQGPCLSCRQWRSSNYWGLFPRA